MTGDRNQKTGWFGIRSLFLFLAALFLSAASPILGGEVRGVTSIIGAMRAHVPFVLVVTDVSSVASPTDEAYGDWADQLNHFAAKPANQLMLIKVSAYEYQSVFSKPEIAGGFATIFVRDDKSALLYKGMILEPQVYDTGEAFLERKIGQIGETSIGLKLTRLELK